MITSNSFYTPQQILNPSWKYGNQSYELFKQKFQTLINRTMDIQPIYWEYQGTSQCLWLGKTKGILSHIQFYITTTDITSNKYEISSNIHGFNKATVIGIENAKLKAQNSLNSYAISITI